MKANTIAMASTVALVFSACVTNEQADGDDLGGGKADSFTPAETRGIWRVANEVTRDELIAKAKVAENAVTEIDAHRRGPDGASGTSDDEAFDSLDELDAVPFVGAKVLDKLLAYAKELG